ncbi:ubiquitin carboxyl-terminal hydrolase 9/13 [Sporothrix brasiliensis 5110]|uniref:ubiquitinyl hydrolase 1 n=1 Tax=Sporothrix brasiliensis 5110 TaxID=1398154 RepID=A0A0C2EZ50_9PEZI|nr:ubiquitin carboxyl-terminal hydrolase 9/13 [Sporothrix brasiliensis 5110]KIH91764.1 ubiquitin carboxyl-terminal hydrolase 9/13 [Sporothrix brasiliensis 5110]
MSTFLSKLKPSAVSRAENLEHSESPPTNLDVVLYAARDKFVNFWQFLSLANNNKKKEEPPPEQTPLEKMLMNAGPIRDDGTDKFFGLENFGNSWYTLRLHYCNSILQALYHSDTFRENVVRFPPYSPAGTPNGKPRKVVVNFRKPSDPPPKSPLVPGTAAAAAIAAVTKETPQQPTAKGRPAANPGQQPNGQQGTRPEDKPDTPEYKKKQAMIKGPVLDLTDNASAYGMEQSTFTSVKDIFMAWIESDSRTGVLSPIHLLDMFRRDNELFRTSMHQDAHEFYGLMLNDIIKNVEEAALQRQEEDKEGLKKSVQAALGDSQSRDETFLDLSIDLEEHSSVTSCLRKFSAEEMLCERNKFHCDHCGGLQEAEKRMKIKRLPKILALHLKRFKYSEDYTKLEKLFHRVVYPYQLRMFNTTDEAQDPDRLYELYAVVIHIGGNAYHGHYVSVIKTKERGWILFDDEMVEPVDKHYVRNFFGDKPGTACAYVLFYQETTFEKMQAEQELEGLEEIRLANMSAGLALSPEEQALRANGIQNGTGSLSRQVTQPAVASPADLREEFIGLEHARTAPGAVLTPISSAPNVPPLPAGISDSTTSPAAPTPIAPVVPPAPAVNTKLEAARLKEEKEREKREAKAAEKARKVQEKENAKELERQRKEREKEREAQRKADAEEMRRVIAASRQTAAEEKDARKNSIDNAAGGGKAAGFLSRSGRGSKSMSRKSFNFLAKEKLEKATIPESPFSSEQTTALSNGSTNGSSVASSNAAIPPTAPLAQTQSPTSLPPLPELAQADKPVRKERFSFSLGRKKSNTFL